MHLKYDGQQQLHQKMDQNTATKQQANMIRYPTSQLPHETKTLDMLSRDLDLHRRGFGNHIWMDNQLKTVLHQPTIRYYQEIPIQLFIMSNTGEKLHFYKLTLQLKKYMKTAKHETLMKMVDWFTEIQTRNIKFLLIIIAW